MANLRAVEDQEPWRLVDEDTDQHSHPFFRMSPGMKMLGAEEEKESKRYLRRNERFRRNVIQYFQEIRQTTYQMWRHIRTPNRDNPWEGGGGQENERGSLAFKGRDGQSSARCRGGYHAMWNGRCPKQHLYHYAKNRSHGLTPGRGVKQRI